jgi:hypothetical protein
MRVAHPYIRDARMPATRNPAAVLLRLAPALAAAAVLLPAALAIGQSAPEGPALLPDLDQEVPTDLRITHVRKGGRSVWRLGFRSAVTNVGDGPLIIQGRRPVGKQTMKADQVIAHSGSPETVVQATGRLRYVTSPDHRHWHLLGFDRYELLRPGGRRSLVSDRKTGFCLGDRYTATGRELPAKAPVAAYTSRCGLDRPLLLAISEGISVGYGDDYAANLEGQWLRLDGLRAGNYVLVHRVNAGRRLRELSYANNASSLLLRLRWHNGVPQITALAACPDSASCAVAAPAP